MKEPSFKFIVVLLGLPLLVAVADWAWTQGPVLKYKSDGVFAYYTIEESLGEQLSSGVITTGSRRAYVQISEAEALNTVGISGTYYLLNFDVAVYLGTGSARAFGGGPIPAQSVTFDKPANHNLSLKVDTNLLGDPFFRGRSGTIPIDYPYIDLTWKRTENDWYRWEGHQIREIGFNLVERSQGSGVRYFTIPSGFVTMPDYGMIVLNRYVDGWLGSQKATTTLIQRLPTK